MTTTQIYKQALNDILNSKSEDVSVLRKIALKAFTQPIRDVADSHPLNWMQFESQQWEWYLTVHEVHVACLVNEEMDGEKWVLFDYDTDFAPIFGDGSAYPTFFESERLTEMDQDLMHEGWGECCNGSIEIEGDNITVLRPAIVTKEIYIEKLKDRLKSKYDSPFHEEIKEFLKELEG